MKNIQKTLVILLFSMLAFPNLGSSQDKQTNELGFEVNKVNPPNLIPFDQLHEAQTLSDLYKFYRPAWVSEYISVEILTSHNGRIKHTLSKNDILTQEQKDNMKMADFGADISVKVKYIPENTLKDNQPKELNFTFAVDPEIEAKYPGGQQQLNKYLQKKAIDKIPGSDFKGFDLTAVKFTINEEGEVTNAHVFESVYQTYNNEKADEILLQAIREMPCWKPAEYSNGIKAKQEFVLTVGNMESCLINLLNIGQE